MTPLFDKSGVMGKGEAGWQLCHQPKSYRTMEAVGLTRYLPVTDPESLVDVELPKPDPQGRDLLVRIEAVSVNPVDTKVRAPKPKVESAPRVLGWDAAGSKASGRR